MSIAKCFKGTKNKELKKLYNDNIKKGQGEEAAAVDAIQKYSSKLGKKLTGMGASFELEGDFSRRREEKTSIKDVVTTKTIKDKVTTTQLNPKGLRNRVFNHFKTALKSVELYEALMTSIDNDTTESAVNAFIQAPESMSFRVFDPLVAITTRYNNKAGAAGIGEMVNASNDSIRSQSRMLKAHVGQGTWGNEFMDAQYSQPLSDKELSGYEKNGTHIKGLIDYVNEYRENNDKDPFTVDQLRQRGITDVLSELTNGFVDIANKDAFITKGGFGSVMNNYASLLLRTGVHPYKITAIISQPIIREYVKLLGQGEGIIKSESSERIRNNLLGKLQGKLKKFTDEQLSDAPQDSTLDSLDYNRLLETSGKDLDTVVLPANLADQQLILRHVEDTLDVVKKYADSVTGSKLGESGAGKTVGAIISNRNKTANSFARDPKARYYLENLENKYFDVNGNPTLLMNFYKNTTDFVVQTIENNPNIFYGLGMDSHSLINYIASTNRKDVVMKNVSLNDLILEHIKLFKLSGFDYLNQLAPENKLEVRAKLFDLKTEGKYKILNKIFPKGDDLVMNKVSILSGSEKESIIQSFKLLKKDHKWATDYLIYEAYSRAGFKPGPLNFTEVIPPLDLIEEGINEYIEDNSNIPVNRDVFMDQFARNEDSKQVLNSTVSGAFDPIADNEEARFQLYASKYINGLPVSSTFFEETLGILPNYSYIKYFTEGYEEQDVERPAKLLGIVSKPDHKGDKSYFAIYRRLTAVPKGKIYYNSNQNAFNTNIGVTAIEEKVEENWEKLLKTKNYTVETTNLDRFHEEPLKIVDMMQLQAESKPDNQTNVDEEVKKNNTDCKTG